MTTIHNTFKKMKNTAKMFLFVQAFKLFPHFVEKRSVKWFMKKLKKIKGADIGKYAKQIERAAKNALKIFKENRDIEAAKETFTDLLAPILNIDIRIE